jgi:hypothetical protein
MGPRSALSSSAEVGDGAQHDACIPLVDDEEMATPAETLSGRMVAEPATPNDLELEKFTAFAIVWPDGCLHQDRERRGVRRRERLQTVRRVKAVKRSELSPHDPTIPTRTRRMTLPVRAE